MMGKTVIVLSLLAVTLNLLGWLALIAGFGSGTTFVVVMLASIIASLVCSGLLGGVAICLAAAIAARARDWLPLSAMVITTLAASAAPFYLSYANSFILPPQRSMWGWLPPTLLSPHDLPVLITLSLAPSLLALLSASLKRRRVPLAIASTTVAALTVALPLIAAPPWTLYPHAIASLVLSAQPLTWLTLLIAAR